VAMALNEDLLEVLDKRDALVAAAGADAKARREAKTKAYIAAYMGGAGRGTAAAGAVHGVDGEGRLGETSAAPASVQGLLPAVPAVLQPGMNPYHRHLHRGRRRSEDDDFARGDVRVMIPAKPTVSMSGMRRSWASMVTEAPIEDISSQSADGRAGGRKAGAGASGWNGPASNRVSTSAESVGELPSDPSAPSLATSSNGYNNRGLADLMGEIWAGSAHTDWSSANPFDTSIPSRQVNPLYEVGRMVEVESEASVGETGIGSMGKGNWVAGALPPLTQENPVCMSRTTSTQSKSSESGH